MALQKNVPDLVLKLARKMLADGVGWNAIGRTTGYDASTIRCRLDPEYAKHRRASINAARTLRESGVGRATLAGVIFRVPPDTRSPMERLFGDPVHGRSALDRRSR